MQSTLDHQRSKSPGANPRSLATRALLAAALLACSAAHAGLVVTSALGDLRAINSGAASLQETVGALNGVIDRSLVSQVFLDTGDGSRAAAALLVSNQPTRLSGFGDSTVDFNNGQTGTGFTGYELLFSLTSRYQFRTEVSLDAVGAGQPQGGFEFDLLGVTGSRLLSSSLGSADVDELLTLDPGDYRVFAFARADSLDGATAFGASRFSFVLSATELEALPPGDVPEPASLALALIGLLACGVVRRRSEPAHHAQLASLPRDATK